MNNSRDNTEWVEVTNKRPHNRKRNGSTNSNVEPRETKWNNTIKFNASRTNLVVKPKFPVHREYDNMKKMLCNNILTSGTCCYGDKCMYAHNLEEQNIDPLRKHAFDIIDGKEKFTGDLDKELAKIFLQLTVLCEDCKNNICQGGYNCKFGTLNIKYQVCVDDLRTGLCYNTSCSCVHLSALGINPLNIPDNFNLATGSIVYTGSTGSTGSAGSAGSAGSVGSAGSTGTLRSSPKLFSQVLEEANQLRIVSPPPSQNYVNKPKKMPNYLDVLSSTDIPDGTLLSDLFFMSLNSNIDLNDPGETSDESVERIRKYLNHNTDSDCSDNEISN